MLGWSRATWCSVKDAPDAPVRVDRVLRSDHSEDWARVVLPRLRAVARPSFPARGRGSRRAWLAASAYERKTTAAALCVFLPLPPEPVDDDAEFWASAEAATQQAEEDALGAGRRTRRTRRRRPSGGARRAECPGGGLGRGARLLKEAPAPGGCGGLRAAAPGSAAARRCVAESVIYRTAVPSASGSDAAPGPGSPGRIRAGSARSRVDERHGRRAPAPAAGRRGTGRW